MVAGKRKQYPRTYNSWRKMRERCYNPKDISYENYGARGIRVCARWLHSFDNFLEDMGGKPDGLTLDRVNNEGDYEPGNCQWSDRLTQNNKRRNVIVVEGLSLARYCANKGLNYKRVHARINRHGMSIENAIKPGKSKGGYKRRPYFWSTQKGMRNQRPKDIGKLIPEWE